MVTHALAYSLAGGAVTTLEQVNAVTDPANITINSNNFVTPAFPNAPTVKGLKRTFIHSIYAMPGTAGTLRVQIQTPSLLRRGVNIDVTSFISGTLPSDNIRIEDYFPYGKMIDAGESLQVQAQAVSSTIRKTAIVNVGDGRWNDLPFSIDPESLFTVRTTNTGTITANGWAASLALTFANTLPNGNYMILGGRYTGANAVYARFVTGGLFWRPGVPGVSVAVGSQAYSEETTLRRFRWGNNGYMGTFNALTPPTVDFFARVADTSQELYLDLEKID